MKETTLSVISIGNLTATQRNQKISGMVPISTVDGSHSETEIPITIIRGSQEGPTLLVLAGVHGSEYTPIVATQRLANNPIQLQRGSLILVHIANLPSYMEKTVYTSPIDGKNLNRVFPGNANGTLTERIADFLVQHVYPLADAVLDMHSGDANEQLSPSYTAYYGKAGSPQVIQSSKDMARAFGLGLTLEFQWEIGNDTDVSKAIWAGSAAVVRGIPSIDVEMAPGMGRFDSSQIDQAYQGVLQVMEHLGIMHSSSEKTKDNLPQSCLVKKRHFIEAQQEGSWVPLVDAGDFVDEGTLLGYTTDFFGRERTLKQLLQAMVCS